MNKKELEKKLHAKHLECEAQKAKATEYKAEILKLKSLLRDSPDEGKALQLIEANRKITKLVDDNRKLTSKAKRDRNLRETVNRLTAENSRYVRSLRRLENKIKQRSS